jgi:hypothetical protein
MTYCNSLIFFKKKLRLLGVTLLSSIYLPSMLVILFRRNYGKIKQETTVTSCLSYICAIYK